LEQHSAGLVRRQERVGLGKQRAVEQRGRHEQDGLRHHTGSMLLVASSPTQAGSIGRLSSGGRAAAESPWQNLPGGRASLVSRGVWRRRVSCCDAVVWRGTSWMFGGGSLQRSVVGRGDTQPQKACVVPLKPPRCTEATSCLLPKSQVPSPDCLSSPPSVCTHRALHCTAAARD